MNLYQQRANSLYGLIALNAPKGVIFLACTNLARLQTANSFYKLGFKILWEKLIFDITWAIETIKIKFYMLYMSEEKALDKVYPTEDIKP
jgi:hypothetical protein